MATFDPNSPQNASDTEPSTQRLKLARWRPPDRRASVVFRWLGRSAIDSANLAVLPVALLALIAGGPAAAMVAGGTVWFAISTVVAGARALGGDIPSEHDRLPVAKLRLPPPNQPLKDPESSG